MLNRVGAALSKYISPISSSKTEVQVDPEKQKEEEKRFTRFKARDEGQKNSSEEKAPSGGSGGDPSAAKAQLRVIKGAEAEPPSELAPVEERPPMPGLSVSHAFLNLMRSISHGKLFFAQWLGRGAYRKVQKSQKRGAHIRKGAMLDQKAE